MKIVLSAIAVCFALACFLFVGVAPKTSAGAAVSEQSCSALSMLTSKDLPNPTAAVTSAKYNAASPAQANSGRGGNGATPALPEHCEVIGKMDERTGANGQKYAIRFHLRLPTEWNGKLFYQAGGGGEGNLGSAIGTLPGQPGEVALPLGYAVVSQDSGHDNMSNNDPQMNGVMTFGFDPQARTDYGYRSYDQVTQAAKAIAKAYYGRMPEKSYFVGCSSGGREALMMAQRYPGDYDGILSCSGAFEMPRALVAGIWDAQALAAAAKDAGTLDPNGQPFINRAFSDDDADLIAQAVLSACDELDGLKDGMVQNFKACTTALVHPKLVAATCHGAKDASCVSAAQVTAIEKIMAGPKNSKGEALYSDWPWDAGIGGKTADGKINKEWRDVKLGRYADTKNSGLYAGLGTGLVSALFMTPPVALPVDGSKYLDFALKFNFDTDAPKIYAKGGEFKEAAMDYMMPNSSDLSAFKKHGSKLLIITGVSDPDFSFNNIARWWEQVNKHDRGKGTEFVRLFAVPGMNHVTGGPSTDRYHAFGTLVSWVEKGEAPERIEATAPNDTPWPNRTRPLCVYPLQARYSGTGSIESAENFVCRMP